VADVQTNVPKLRKKFGYTVVGGGRWLFANQDHDVNIGEGVQLTPAVPANCNEGSVAEKGVAVLVPEPDQEVIDQVGAAPHQV